MRRKSIAIVMILATLSFAAGDEPDATPRTPAAKGALVRLEQARDKARVEFERAVATAQDEAAKELETIKADVMKRGDLDEANRIAKAVEAIGNAANDASLEGDWTVQFPRGVQKEYRFLPAGKMRVIYLGVTYDGQWERRGDVYMINDGKAGGVKQLTIAGSKFFLDFGEGDRRSFGMGVRSR